jgi:hypothetical protein
MKKLAYAFATVAALAIMATPAVAQVVTATNVTNGTALTTVIHESKDTGPLGTADNVNVVYGSTAGPGYATTDVKFTGNTSKQNNLTDTPLGSAAIDISDGGGFATLKDSTADTATLWSVIVNPDEMFTDMKFAVQLQTGGTLEIYYLLAGQTTFSTLCATCSYSASQANTNYLIDVTGGLFDAIQLVSHDPPGSVPSLKELKQFSYNAGDPPAVPEPATWAMMLLGFGGIGAVMRRRRRLTNTGRLLQIA